MLAIKDENLRVKVIDHFKKEKEFNKDSLIKYCKHNNISFTLAEVCDEYIQIVTDTGSCLIDDSFCPHDCQGDYLQFSKDNFLIHELIFKIGEDTRNVNKDVVGLNEISLNDLIEKEE